MRYLRRTSNYLERLIIFDVAHMISIAYLVAIRVERPRIGIGCSLKKEFTEVIHMNP